MRERERDRGCGGVGEVMRHAFFEDVAWGVVERKGLVPPFGFQKEKGNEKEKEEKRERNEWEEEEEGEEEEEKKKRLPMELLEDIQSTSEKKSSLLSEFDHFYYQFEALPMLSKEKGGGSKGGESISSLIKKAKSPRVTLKDKKSEKGEREEREIKSPKRDKLRSTVSEFDRARSPPGLREREREREVRLKEPIGFFEKKIGSPPPPGLGEKEKEGEEGNRLGFSSGYEKEKGKIPRGFFFFFEKIIFFFIVFILLFLSLSFLLFFSDLFCLFVCFRSQTKEHGSFQNRER